MEREAKRPACAERIQQLERQLLERDEEKTHQKKVFEEKIELLREQTEQAQKYFDERIGMETGSISELQDLVRAKDAEIKSFTTLQKDLELQFNRRLSYSRGMS